MRLGGVFLVGGLVILALFASGFLAVYDIRMYQYEDKTNTVQRFPACGPDCGGDGWLRLELGKVRFANAGYINGIDLHVSAIAVHSGATVRPISMRVFIIQNGQVLLFGAATTWLTADSWPHFTLNLADGEEVPQKFVRRASIEVLLSVSLKDQDNGIQFRAHYDPPGFGGNFDIVKRYGMVIFGQATPPEKGTPGGEPPGGGGCPPRGPCPTDVERGRWP